MTNKQDAMANALYGERCGANPSESPNGSTKEPK